MKLNKFSEFKLFEGIRKTENGYEFDFKDDNENDILSLKFSSTRRTKKTMGNTVYSYYFAYSTKNTHGNNDLLKSIKYLDDNISKNDLRIFVNKAVMGFYDNFGGNYDTIVAPNSSSKILDEVIKQLNNKIGN